MRFAVIYLRCETTLAGLRNEYGITTDAQAAGQAIAERNREASEAFQQHLLPRTSALLGHARTALALMPPADHHCGWKLLLDDLALAAAQIRRTLDATPANVDERTIRTRDAKLWPYLSTWADHGYIVRDLADQHRTPTPGTALSADEQQQWTVCARSARARGMLDVFDSWYDAAGRLITLAYLDDEDATILALAGDLDGPDVQVLGRYDTEYGAGQASPPQVPAGVLVPRASHSTGSDMAVEVSVKALTSGVIKARHSGEVAEALLVAVDHNLHAPGPLARLNELVGAAAHFADALETRQGHRLAGRLTWLTRQLDTFAHELQGTADELASLAGVLPPHHVASPRHLSAHGQSALGTAPPAGPAPSTSTAPAARR
ncbi:hypothetical protein [Streptomyces sp. NPDC088141]|uniref:hypothetical protein n=1 Tax=Streptomyces sp. NPDC088141 TaxID=3155179 RepID=UPI0034476187